MARSTDNLLKKLPDFYDKRAQSNNYGFIKSFGIELDVFEEQMNRLKESIQISTASGQQLDDIGSLFKLQRQVGEADSQFRTRIQTFWQSQLAGGIISGIRTTVSSIAGISEDQVIIHEYAPMKFSISLEVGFTTEGVDILKLIEDSLPTIKAAGVYALVSITNSFVETIDNLIDNIETTETFNLFVGEHSAGDIYGP